MTARKNRPFNGYDPRAGIPGGGSLEPHPCEWPGCREGGEYRAPRSRDDLTRHRWFCLDHVRLYNEAWNYYAGMSEAEVEADLRADTIGRRPTWPMGARARADNVRFAGMHAHDPFGLFEDESEHEASERMKQSDRIRSPEHDAMMVMNLRPPLTLAMVKSRYKKLVKIYHPDANGGDKASEEKFKEINQAYRTIIASLTA